MTDQLRVSTLQGTDEADKISKARARALADLQAREKLLTKNIQFSQKGSLKTWNNDSGHFQPKPENSSIVKLPQNQFVPESE